MNQAAGVSIVNVPNRTKTGVPRLLWACASWYTQTSLARATSRTTMGIKAELNSVASVKKRGVRSGCFPSPAR